MYITLAILLLLPLLFSEEWIARISALIERHVWEKAEVIWTLFVLYHVCLVADLMVKFKAKKLTLGIAWQTFLSYLGRTIGAIASLFVARFLGEINWVFGWIPQLILSALAGVVAVQTFKFMSRLGVLPMAVYVLLDQKINQTLNSTLLEDENLKKHERDSAGRDNAGADKPADTGAEKPVKKDTSAVV